MILEICLAACINAFFMWPVDNNWNLGDRVHGIAAANNGTVAVKPYANYDQNIIVTITKSETKNGCSKVMVKIDPVRRKLIISVGIKPLILIINKVCTGKNA